MSRPANSVLSKLSSLNLLSRQSGGEFQSICGDTDAARQVGDHPKSQPVEKREM